LLLKLLPFSQPYGPSRCRISSRVRSNGCPAAAECPSAAPRLRPMHRPARDPTGKTSATPYSNTAQMRNPRQI
jgi:hypothetical protein